MTMQKGFNFICGTKRSATHYLNRLFDGHPELANTINESYIFEYYNRNGKKFEDQIVLWLKTAPVFEIYDNILSRQLLPAFKDKNIYDFAFKEQSGFEMNFDCSNFCKLLDKERRQISSIKDFIQKWMSLLSLFSPWSVLNNEKKWIFKCADFGNTVLGANRLGLLKSVIFLVRDPIGIVNSLKKRREHEKHREFHIFELFEICEALENVPIVLRSIEGKYLLVSYEDIIKNNKNILDEICNYLEISWNSCLESPTLLGKPWHINSSFASKKDRKNILTLTEIAFIKQNTKNYQEYFGYID